MKILIFCVLLTFIALANSNIIRGPPTVAESAKIRYDNYTVYKLQIKNEAQLAIINDIQNLRDKYNIWKEYDHISKEIHIMVKPTEKANFMSLMRGNGLNAEVMISNVQNLIDEEQFTSKSADDNTFGWTRYYELHEIEQWLDGVLAEYPAVTSSFSIGKTYEGRDIRGIKISFKANNPGIFIESNVHAREWITSASATWLINQLLTSLDTGVRNLAENYDWYIIPVYNMDGFHYSHVKDRMWRKSRQPAATSNCIGADINRNFDCYWLFNNGASPQPCDETYAGSTPFSEPEAKALAEYVTSIQDKIKIYISFHSYGQYLLSPYGHTKDEVPDNYEDLYAISEAFRDAILNLPYRTNYTIGSTGIALYIASGTSVDWVYNATDIKITYTIEYRDTGRFGFILPPVQILPTCEELMAGLLALIDKTKQLGYV